MSLALEREVIEDEIPEQVDAMIEGLDREFAEKTKRVLGYTGLSSRFDEMNRERDAKNARRALLVMMAEIGIRPFTRESVDAYKKAMVEPEPSGAPRPVAATRDVTSRGRGWFSGLVGDAPAPRLPETAREVADAFDRATGRAGQARKTWVRVPLSEPRTAEEFDQRVRGRAFGQPWQYSQPIPAHILMDAVRLTEHAEKHGCVVSLDVDALMERRYLPDPFLVATIDGHEFYIAVWDEPTFKGERED